VRAAGCCTMANMLKSNNGKIKLTEESKYSFIGRVGVCLDSVCCTQLKRTDRDKTAT